MQLEYCRHDLSLIIIMDWILDVVTMDRSSGSELVDEIVSCKPKARHLLYQFLVQRHGFDMGEDPLTRFQTKVDEGFPSDAGDKRCSDIQQHVCR